MNSDSEMSEFKWKSTGHGWADIKENQTQNAGS
jgi:hypothetical protein